MNRYLPCRLICLTIFLCGCGQPSPAPPADPLAGRPRRTSGGPDAPTPKWNAPAANPTLPLPTLRATLVPLQVADVTSVAFSPDGKTLVSGTNGSTVILWDVATGKQKDMLGTKVTELHTQAHGQPVWCVAFSSDGKLLATGSLDDKVKLWDMATGKETATLNHSGWVWSVAFSGDGKLLASGSDHKTILWDVATGKETASLKDYAPLSPAAPDAINRLSLWNKVSVALNGDGTLLATVGRGGALKLWDVATNKEKAFKHKAGVFSVAFSGDGTLLASANQDGTVTLWDVATLKEKATFKGHAGDDGASMAFSGDGGLLAVAASSQAGSGAVWFVDVATGKEQAILTGLNSNRMAISGDGKLLAVAAGDLVYLWDNPVTKKGNE